MLYIILAEKFLYINNIRFIIYIWLSKTIRRKNLANHKSALKRARQNEVRNSRNRANKSKIKTVVRRVNEAIDSKAPEEAEKALQEAIPVIQKAATKGTLHKKTASRKVSRLTRRINKFKEVQEATS